jgi:CRISPR/Cas system-associated endoribonuclease Cas2
MAYYLISYDVRAINHDYEPLYKQLGDWRAAHLQNSVWLAELKGPAATIRDILQTHMHSNDTICVIQIFPNSDWATRNARKTGIDWLTPHLAA